MSRRSTLLVAVLLGGTLAAAGPQVRPGQALRDAYAAFARGDLGRAAELYEAAAERTTDPALVAFDLAGVRYRQALAAGDPRLLAEAERNYRCCLDRADPRRAAALHGLGNCLLARGARRDAAALREALDVYGQCLREPGLAADLADAARYNCEKARLLLLQARAARAASADNPPDSPEPNPWQPERTPAQEDPAAGLGEPGAGDPVAGSTLQPYKGDAEGTGREGNAAPRPGAGNLPPIPDDEQAAPLSPQDAAAHLEQASARIRAERQQAQRANARQMPAAGVRDW